MIAFVFPGQGSQRPAMGAPWQDHPSWDLVREATEASGRDVARLLLDADAEELRDTRNAQLATLVLSLVVLDAVERIGIEPAAMAGHSLGEYTALVAAGTMSFADGVRLVAERGDAMAAAAEAQPGTMAAVLGLDDDEVATACARSGHDVWVANENAPGQVVIAGTTDGVTAASELARELGARKVLPVAVAGAFHTPLMAPARDRLRKAISGVELRDADVDVVANVDGRPHRGAVEWPGLMAGQLCSPVRWRACLHALESLGATEVVELGPGTVLTGTVKRTLTGVRASSVSTPAGVDALVEQLTDGRSTGGATAPEGEALSASERLIVSPAAGVFTPDAALTAGSDVRPGVVIGRVSDTEVRSPFGGMVAGVLASTGQRLTRSQPIAWLRAG
ncbi:MAG: ACP S-malonyltransferase [Acidimicrobiia bacterium]|nr:ACP S-malonyltransferase [Acidimicrobiia bacterium]